VTAAIGARSTGTSTARSPIRITGTYTGIGLA
jgi:hypothetical protein